MLKQKIEIINGIIGDIQQELAELKEQGELTENNVTKILALIADAYYYAREAKWRGVEHLRVKEHHYNAY